jgi:hypothetical protein
VLRESGAKRRRGRGGRSERGPRERAVDEDSAPRQVDVVGLSGIDGWDQRPQQPKRVRSGGAGRDVGRDGLERGAVRDHRIDVQEGDGCRSRRMTGTALGGDDEGAGDGVEGAEHPLEAGGLAHVVGRGDGDEPLAGRDGGQREGVRRQPGRAQIDPPRRISVGERERRVRCG